MRKFSGFIAVIAGLVLTGCAVGPDFHSPPPPKTTSYTKTPLPKKTASVAEAGQVGQAQYLQLGRNIPAEWWRLFRSPGLNYLIRTGLANSPTLAGAEATLRQAQQNLRATIGNLLFPSVDLQALAQRTRTSSLAAGVGPTGGSNTANIFTVYNTAVNASYTLDVFGGLRRQVEASRAQVDYERYQLAATYLSLTSNIVTTAIAVANFQAQVQATRELIREEAKLVSVMKQQLTLGGVSYEDVLTQETQLAQTEALIPPLQVQLAQSQNALAVLVGELPSQSRLPPLSLDALHLPTHLPLSVPSQLVQQRPDVQAAAAQLHVASANIGVATANLLPQFPLSASFGYVAGQLNVLFTPSSVVWNLAGKMLQPIFHGGELIAERRAAVDAYQAAFAQYRQTVLQAFQNVADALQALVIDTDEFKAQKKAEISAQKTFIITRQRFRLGGQNFLNVLTAEQQYEKAKINRIKAQAQRYADTAALFQALGGGWWRGKNL